MNTFTVECEPLHIEYTHTFEYSLIVTAIIAGLLLTAALPSVAIILVIAAVAWLIWLASPAEEITFTITEDQNRAPQKLRVKRCWRKLFREPVTEEVEFPFLRVDIELVETSSSSVRAGRGLPMFRNILTDVETKHILLMLPEATNKDRLKREHDQVKIFLRLSPRYRDNTQSFFRSDNIRHISEIDVPR